MHFYDFQFSTDSSCRCNSLHLPFHIYKTKITQFHDAPFKLTKFRQPDGKLGEKTLILFGRFKGYLLTGW
jgi:hypothetical protein